MYPGACLVRVVGLEPTSIAALEPKAEAGTVTNELPVQVIKI